MSGTFGYELDLSRLSPEETEEIRRQIRQFHADEELLLRGRYYRLETYNNEDAVAWMLVNEDQNAALLTVVITAVHANAPQVHVKLKGLCPDALYLAQEDGRVHSGAALMHAGYALPLMTGDYPAFQLHLVRAEHTEA